MTSNDSPLQAPAFVFFFNDPAPPEISTLSLHDALPICAPGGPRRRHGGPAWPPPAAAHSAPARGRPAGWADRKSTRLNSSHVRISYAVFCLKKKKTNSTCMTMLDRDTRNQDHTEVMSDN